MKKEKLEKLTKKTKKELEKLNKKTIKLHEFMKRETDNQTISNFQYGILSVQLAAMDDYSSALNQRIQDFKYLYENGIYEWKR